MKINSYKNSKYDQFAKVIICEKSEFLQFAKIDTLEMQFFLTRENKYSYGKSSLPMVKFLLLFTCFWWE